MKSIIEYIKFLLDSRRHNKLIRMNLRHVHGKKVGEYKYQLELKAQREGSYEGVIELLNNKLLLTKATDEEERQFLAKELELYKLKQEDIKIFKLFNK